MASKFGKFGDLDNLVKGIRDDVQHASATVNMIRRGLEDGMDPQAAAKKLQEVEDKLDGLLQV